MSSGFYRAALGRWRPATGNADRKHRGLKSWYVLSKGRFPTASDWQRGFICQDRAWATWWVCIAEGPGDIEHSQRFGDKVEAIRALKVLRILYCRNPRTGRPTQP